MWYEAQIKESEKNLTLIKQENREEIKSELLEWQKNTIKALYL